MRIRTILSAMLASLFVASVGGVAMAQALLPEEIDYQPTLTTGCGTKESPPPVLHCEVLRVLERISKIGVGSTRGDLVKLFVMSGGLSTNRQGTYNYRESFYIQVDVEFANASLDARSLSDVITKISRPYIAYPVAD